MIEEKNLSSADVRRKLGPLAALVSAFLVSDKEFRAKMEAEIAAKEWSDLAKGDFKSKTQFVVEFCAKWPYLVVLATAAVLLEIARIAG